MEKRFRGGLVFKTRRLLYHSTLGLKAMRRKKKKGEDLGVAGAARPINLISHKLFIKPFYKTGSVR